MQASRWVVAPTVPKSLLIAYIAAGAFGEIIEVWVDFE